MKKVTKYKVSGISNTKPEVSKDFTVEEIVEEVPMDGLVITSTRGNVLQVTEVTSDDGVNAKLSAGTSYRHLNVESAKELRDWLTEFIDSNAPELKVFKDRDGSFQNRWFELPNGNYTYGSSRQDADQCYDQDNTTGWPLSRVRDTYGPLVQDTTK